MLDSKRLKTKLVAACAEEGEELNSDKAIDRIMEKFATAICEEIQQVAITYVSGLTAGTLPVTGVLVTKIN